jgi:lipopolysaccharide transport system ATP-binding protein
MDGPAIRVGNLGKRYRLASGPGRMDYRTLRESLTSLMRKPFSGRAKGQEFWALNGIDFEVKPGEVVGIVGRNGAGKSTLLKVLSRITKPTKGFVELNGRVGSLLEVGTGFHPELTGRENIFLNGSILGMARREIAAKFDEIVAFAEVEKFLDTPVKRYSSGMYVRLAFAVAAHLEPEILIVDEVLAVGDATFQRKCLGKMGEVSKTGRTILFVSHNMQAITRLCPRAILLDRGKVIADGPSPEVTRAYLHSDQGTSASRVWNDPATAPGNAIAKLKAFRIRDREGSTREVFYTDEPVGMEITFEVLQAGHVMLPNFPVHNDDSVCVFHTLDADPQWKRTRRPPGTYTTTAWIPGDLLNEGTLMVGASVTTYEPVTIHFHEADAVAFQVIDRGDGMSTRGDYHGAYPGAIRPRLEWQTKFVPAGTPA